MLNLKSKICFFNMIEIVLAIAILAFGFASILGLFPVALKAVRNSQVEGIAADAANDLYGYYKSYAYVPNSLVSGEFLYKDLLGYTSGNGSLVDWYEEADLNAFRTVHSLGTDERNGQVFYANLLAELKLGSPDLEKSGIGLKKVIGLFQPSINSYFYLVKGSEDLKKIDFTAQVFVWRTKMEKVYNVGESGVTKVGYDRAVILNVEISWPINVPYPDREKRYYQFSITNPKKL